MVCPSVVVVGGGIGGLAGAVRLAARGARVTVIEKNPRLGGKLNLWQTPHPARPDDRPFSFDTGPSLLTLPFVFKDLFEAAGEDVRDHLPITKLSPVSRFVWRDGTTFELYSDESAMRREVQRVFPNDIEGWDAFYNRGRHIWDLAGEFFLMNAPEQLMKSDDFRPLDGLKMLSIPFRIGMFGKFAREVDRHIRSPRLREVLYQYATYSGASPFLCPATLAVIPFCELHFGGWYIQGGMYTLARALETVARKLGVEIRTSTSVTSIETAPNTDKRSKKRHRVTGVRLNSGEVLPADAILCNADVPWANEHLLKRPAKPLSPGGSGMVLLLGVEGTYPQLVHHTKFMPDDYASDLRAMFDTKTIPADPCIYLCASTRTDPTQAPERCENLFVLCSAPALNGSLDWTTQKQRYRDQIVRTLETKCGLNDLSRRIVVESSWCPQDLASTYNAHAGSIYGISSNGIRNAFLRPPNRDKRIAGLYFAGGTTHPGGGLPLVALSGKIASQMVSEDLGLTD
ncbi:MAG: phytoene desaturase family protein [Tepidisphaeraceae bacterium]